MYHQIVRKRLYKIFARLNQGDCDLVLQDLAPEFRHVFYGTHTFGGVRTRKESVRAWFERLFHLFPDIQFDVESIVVSGWPWDTVVAVVWRDRFTTADGQQHSNAGVNYIRLRWARVIELRVYHDTEKLSAVCQQQHRLDIQEATSPQIVDGPMESPRPIDDDGTRLAQSATS